MVYLVQKIIETLYYLITETGTLPSDMYLSSIDGGKTNTSDLTKKSVTATVTAGDNTPTRGAAIVSFTNNINVGDLELTKKVAGDMPYSDAAKQFEFTITLTAPEDGSLANSYNVVKTSSADVDGTPETKALTWATETIEEQSTVLTNKKGSFTVTLGKDEKITVKDLPARTTYSITETSTQGYIPTVTTGNASGTITGGAVAKESVTFTNTPLTSVNGTKTWVTDGIFLSFQILDQFLAT